MTDDRISLLARAYHADKGDLEAARGLVAAYQRTGREVPYALRLATSTLFTELPANAQGMPEFRHRTTGAVFVLIPAGEFLMGSPEGEGSDDERPQHRRVFSEPFLMAKYPFTAREWFRITGEAPSHFPTEGPGASRLSRMDSDGRLWGDHPVESVSWDHCREVVDRINRLDFARSSGARFKSADETWVSWAEVEWGDESMHLAPHPRREDGEVDVAILGLLAFDETDEAIYQAWLWNDAGERVGFQLPTEACWEYATRAGSNTQYPNGDTLADLDQIAWYGGNWRDGHKAVGMKKPNAWGLHDVVGNVFEWTRSAWTRDYEGAPENGFAGGEQGPDPTHTDSVFAAAVGSTPIKSVGRACGAQPGEASGALATASDRHGAAEGEQSPDPTSGASFVPAPGVTLRPSAARPCAAETCLDGATTSASDPSIAGDEQGPDPTASASAGAVVGATPRPSAARPCDSMTGGATGAANSASGLLGASSEGEQSSDPTAGASVAAVVGPTPRPSVARPIGGRSQGGDSTLDSALPGEPLEVEESSDPIHPTRPCAAAVGAVGSRAWRQPLYDTERFPAATVVSPIRIFSDFSDFSAFYNQPAAAAAAAAASTTPPGGRVQPPGARTGRLSETSTWASAQPGVEDLQYESRRDRSVGVADVL